MKRKLAAAIVLLIGLAAALISSVTLTEADRLAAQTALGAVQTPFSVDRAAASAFLDAVGALNISLTERVLLALACVAAAALIFGVSGRAVGPYVAEQKGGAVAIYDEELAAAAPRRRVTDAGSGPIVFGVAIAGVFFGGLALWSALAPLQSAAIAPARIAVESSRRTLDHPYGGEIAELLVREGEAVRDGQILLRLDTTEVAAERAVLSRRRDAATALAARRRAELTDAPSVRFPDDLRARARTDPELAEMIDGQARLFEAARAAFEGEIEIGRQRVAQLRERVRGLRLQLAATEDQLALIADEQLSIEPLLDRGLTVRSRILALRRERAVLEGEIGQLTATVAQTEAQIGEIEIVVLQRRRERLAESSEALRAAEDEILQITPRVEALDARVARAELAAPASGAVIGLTKFTVGGAILPGEPILDIVPEDAELIVEARFALVDRDVLRPGMAAKVRLTAFDIRQMEPIDGVLQQVSADAMVDDQTQQNYYRGRIALPPQILSERRIDLAPGMPAEVIVPLAARTPLQYLLEPLARNWGLAMREQ